MTGHRLFAAAARERPDAASELEGELLRRQSERGGLADLPWL